jgi:hypothetical protein
VECETDYKDFICLEGRRLNTQSPSWATVFPERFGKCRFCKEWLPDGEEKEGNCMVCNKFSILQLIVKYAPKRLYPKM